MKKESKKAALKRREFIGLAALGLTSLTILPSYTIAGRRIPPSDRLYMGLIGAGQQGINDYNSFASVPGVQFVAGSDVDSMKVERFKRLVIKRQGENGGVAKCDGYEFYEDLLARKDIDAVAIATPDHWHALNTIHACQSGKDVYVQKPLAFTVQEAIEMVKVSKETGRVVQVGSQQRSSKEFIRAIEIVRSGEIGHIEKIYARVGDPPKPFDLPKMPVPTNLNWNAWVGPLQDDNFHYNSDLCPPISLDPPEKEKLWGAWRWYMETGNGFTADWGAHMFDIGQWAMGKDGSGPVEIIPKGYNGQSYLTFKYANGVEMTEQPYVEEVPDAKGVKIFGSEGWIEVGRGYLGCSNKKLVPKEIAGFRPENLTPEQRRKRYEEMQKMQEKGGGSFEISSPHMQNFVDSVKSRQDPVAPIEVGASTSIACSLANMATELKRPVKWNPATQRYINDKEAEAHRLNHYDYRTPYKL